MARFKYIVTDQGTMTGLGRPQFYSVQVKDPEPYLSIEEEVMVSETEEVGLTFVV